MGQNTSSLPFDFVDFKDDIYRQTQILKELATVSYDEFLEKVKELNNISQTLGKKSGGRNLVFAVKKGTDASVLWKGTVRVGCVLVDSSSGKIESYRLITLKQFLRVYTTLTSYVSASYLEASKEEITEAEEPVTVEPTMAPFSPSMILEGLDAEPCDPAECCICMERKTEVILPCAHSYCLVCIEQWNVSNKTCPICREKLDSTDDSWVISEAPDLEEVNAELQRTLVGLAGET